MKSLIKYFAMSTALLLASFQAQAALILGGDLFVEEDGEVKVEFLGHTAKFSNDLYLYVVGDDDQFIFNNHDATVGDMVSLGTDFVAGEELLFYIFVNNTGNTFYSGSDASMNADNILHTMVDYYFTPTQTYVGFEDLLGGGDRDFDDLEFLFTNVGGGGIRSIPEPSTLMIMSLALLGLVTRRKLQS